MALLTRPQLFSWPALRPRLLTSITSNVLQTQKSNFTFAVMEQWKPRVWISCRKEAPFMAAESLLPQAVCPLMTTEWQWTAFRMFSPSVLSTISTRGNCLPPTPPCNCPLCRLPLLITSSKRPMEDRRSSLSAAMDWWRSWPRGLSWLAALLSMPEASLCPEEWAS